MEVYKLQQELLNESNKILGLSQDSRVFATKEQLKSLVKNGFNDFNLKIEDLNLKYPSFKFLHKSAIKIVCKKYNLYFGDVNIFIGKIPKKNADEILNKIEFIKNKNKIVDKYEAISFNGHSYDANNFVNRFGSDAYITLKKTGEFKYKPTFGKMRHFSFHECESVQLPTLKIKVIAPLNDFDLSGMKVSKKNKIKKIKVEDPIILAKIDNGIWAVLTAWGPEAEDTNIFNENYN